MSANLQEILNSLTGTAKERFEKAITAAENLATAGKMNPVQAKKFLDWVVDETGLKGQVRIVQFEPDELKIEKIGVGQRVAVPADEAQDPGLRREITTSKIVLHPEEFMVPWEISLRFLETNIEGMSVEDHIAKMLAAQAANNFEELYLLADKTGPAAVEKDLKDGGAPDKYVLDTFLAKLNGWSKLADQGHLINWQGQPISGNTFGQMITAMPTKYRRGLGNMRVLLSPDLWQRYLEKVATRQGNLGDAVLGGAAHTPYGLTALPIPLWPFRPKTVEHVTLTAENQVSLKYTNVSNVVVTPTNIGKTAINAYTLNTDYAVDLTAGKINRIDIGGAIGDGATVKVTYDASPQMILTHRDNLILGIGRNITLGKDIDIYRRTRQYALTMCVDVQIQNPDAVVKVYNIGE